MAHLVVIKVNMCYLVLEKLLLLLLLFVIVAVYILVDTVNITRSVIKLPLHESFNRPKNYFADRNLVQGLTHVYPHSQTYHIHITLYNSTLIYVIQ